MIEANTPYAWCGGPIPVNARRDAVCCSQRYRQARHQFRRAASVTGAPFRLAYADPSYPIRPGCTGTTPTTRARSTTPT